MTAAFRSPRWNAAARLPAAPAGARREPFLELELQPLRRDVEGRLGLDRRLRPDTRDLEPDDVDVIGGGVLAVGVRVTVVLCE